MEPHASGVVSSTVTCPCGQYVAITVSCVCSRSSSNSGSGTGWVPSRGTELVLSLGTTLGVAVLSLPLLLPTRRAGVRLRPTLRLPVASIQQTVNVTNITYKNNVLLITSCF